MGHTHIYVIVYTLSPFSYTFGQREVIDSAHTLRKGNRYKYQEEGVAWF
jgi:hypothetical protein